MSVKAAKRTDDKPVSSIMVWAGSALVSLLSVAAPHGLAALPPYRPIVSNQATDSLLAAARRATRAWHRHDFASLVGAGGAILLRLPGVQPASPLPPAQAAELLRSFAESAVELEVAITVARDVDPNRAYVEVRRVFTSGGSRERQQQTIYLGMRRAGRGYRLAEVRVVP